MTTPNSCADSRAIALEATRFPAQGVPGAWLVCVMLALSGLVGQVASLAEDIPPVLLRQTSLFVPVEVAGSNLAPELKVRVLVNARGLVTDVEVLSIEPSSEYDEAIRSNTITELKRWRYAPATRGGEPTEATLDWVVKFQAGQHTLRASGGRTRSLVPWFVEANEDLEARRARVMSLPLEKRREILLSYSKTAERFLIGSRRREFSTPRFLVITDAEDPDLARIVGGNLEATLHFIGQVMQPDIAPQPSDLRMLVYLYSQKSAYDEVRRELSTLNLGSAAYFAPGLILFHTQTDHLMSLLIHEASHGYSDHELRRPGTRLPRWLEEGFAEYMGNSQVKKGKLLPGKTIKRQFVLNHFGVQKQTTVAGWDLRKVKEVLRAGEGLSLEEMISADADLFYGDRGLVYYGMSWLFVHYLRHGEADWADQRFPALMLYLAEGYPAREAVEAAYSRSLADLEKPFLEYVMKF